MKYAFTSLAFGLGVSAISLPRDTCTFTLTASGGQSGVVGQLGDGQNRIGGENPTGTYTINNGQITDAQGRGCILTPPTTQFQCDVGATPTGGFSIGGDGEIEYNGSPTFYACPASDTMYNIYTTPVEGQDKCVKIGLTASGCYAPSSSYKSSPPETKTVVQTAQQSCPAPVTKTITEVKNKCVKIGLTASGCYAPSSSYKSSPPETKTVVQTAQQSCPAPVTKTITEVKTEQGPTVTQVQTTEQSCPAPETITKTEQGPTVIVTQPAKETPTKSEKPTTQESAPTQTSTGKTCPTTLSGEYQYPHLIVPVSKSNKDTAYGTSYNGKITSDISTIFNFDIPSSYTGTCSLVFLFPEQSQLETSSFTFSGNGEFDFTQLSSVATQSTTYATQGGVKTDFGVKTATPGSSVVVSTFACPAGQAVSYEISSASGSSLEYFQDYNPSPIGLYITTC